MVFTPLALEEWQSTFENTVAYNLADSGVATLRLGELLDEPDSIGRLLDVDLQYPEVRGARHLREAIAAWYGAEAEQVLVTVGGAEASFIAVGALVNPDDWPGRPSWSGPRCRPSDRSGVCRWALRCRRAR